MYRSFCNLTGSWPNENLFVNEATYFMLYRLKNITKIYSQNPVLDLDNLFIEKGKIIQLSQEQSNIRILVDAGLPLNVLIPRESFAAHDMGVGDEVWITCPEAGIDIF